VSEKKEWKKSEGITQQRTKLSDEKLHNLYSAPIILENRMKGNKMDLEMFFVW
jgi:hypothetical protein